MTSARQLAANRLNAQKASGPKTGQGKRRSAVNATWHGLTAPLQTSFWGAHLPAVQSALQADGLTLEQAQALALRILEYERNLQHQRNRYLFSLGLAAPEVDPSVHGREERQMALAMLTQRPAKGSGIPGVSRQAAESAARFLMRVGTKKQRNAEQELRNADRHLRHAANQLVKQCRALGL